MTTLYDITNIDRDKLLYELWKNSTNKYNHNKVVFDIVIAKRQMYGNYPDYICGRPIKVDIYNDNIVDSTLYDRENGNDAFFNTIINLTTNDDIHVDLQIIKNLPHDIIIQTNNIYKELFE